MLRLILALCAASLAAVVRSDCPSVPEAFMDTPMFFLPADQDGDGCSDDRELASFLTTYFIDDHGYDVSDFNCAARMLTSLVNDDVAQSSLCDATLIEKGYTWRQFEEVRKESMVACGVDLAHQRDFPGLST